MKGRIQGGYQMKDLETFDDIVKGRYIIDPSQFFFRSRSGRQRFSPYHVSRRISLEILLTFVKDDGFYIRLYNMWFPIDDCYLKSFIHRLLGNEYTTSRYRSVLKDLKITVQFTGKSIWE